MREIIHDMIVAILIRGSVWRYSNLWSCNAVVVVVAKNVKFAEAKIYRTMEIVHDTVVY